MKPQTVTFVRVYLREGEHLLDALVRFLRKEQGIAGLTVERGVLGFGADRVLHTAALTDLSLDLPLVVEFFDEPVRTRAAVEQMLERFELLHVVSWEATRWEP